MKVDSKMHRRGVQKCLQVLTQLRIQMIIMDLWRINLHSIISAICNRLVLIGAQIASIWAYNNWRGASKLRSKRPSLLARTILLAFRPRRLKLSLVAVEARLAWILYVAPTCFRTTLNKINKRMMVLLMRQFKKSSQLLKARIQDAINLLRLYKINKQ